MRVVSKLKSAGLVMTENEKKDRAYLFFFIVGVCVLVLTLFEINQGAEALVMLLVFYWQVTVPVILTMIVLSAAATMYSLVTRPRDWALLILAGVTIPYELLALNNVIFFVPVFVLSTIGVEVVSIVYAVVAIGFFVTWVLGRRNCFEV